jgi:UDPglucose 6-dehydrogenase
MVIVTEWTQFRALDLARLKREMAGSVFIDLRNVYSPQEMEVCGFIYEGVGRAGASAIQFHPGRV